LDSGDYTKQQEGEMIQAVLQAAHYQAPTETGMQDARGVRCTFTMEGAAGKVGAQLDSVGCLTLTYHPPDGDPYSFFVGFMEDLPACRQLVTTDRDLGLTMEAG
jgi:hypothetical protein